MGFYSPITPELTYSEYLNNIGPPIHGFFSINILENIVGICDKLKKLTDEPCSLEIFFKN